MVATATDGSRGGTARFFAARPEDERAVLDRLLQDEIQPTVSSVVRRRLMAGVSQVGADDREDVVQQALGSLIRRLMELKRQGEAGTIDNLTGYSARAAHNACDEFFRRRFPVRSSLAARVRSTLKNQPGLAVWQDSSGLLVGGFEAWQPKPPVPAEARMRELQESTRRVAERIYASGDAVREPIAGSLAKAIEWAGGPVPVDLLVNLLADARNERDLLRAEDRAEDTPGTVIEEIRDEQTGAEELHAMREFLSETWEELAQLPPRQAQALLLNLRDHGGRGVIDVLILTSVASLVQIAEVLGMTATRLAEIWNDLPWQDAEIAELMGCRPIDVSNLRAVARRRLGRRLGAEN